MESVALETNVIGLVHAENDDCVTMALVCGKLEAWETSLTESARLQQTVENGVLDTGVAVSGRHETLVASQTNVIRLVGAMADRRVAN